jgi:microcystin-dependent protein
MDNFIGEIRPAGFNFAPQGWALCQGQILPISQNTALFSLLGTTYGGNGLSTFALPDLQGNVAVSSGQGPGLSSYVLGEVDGSSGVTLLTSQIPLHSHNVVGQSAAANSDTPSGRFPALTPRNCYDVAADGFMSPDAVISDGGGQPHNNMQPYCVINYIIALNGIFPSRP